MNCINIRIRSKNYKKYIYCKKYKKEIEYSDCYNCSEKDHKKNIILVNNVDKCDKITKNSTKHVKKNKKIVKMEKNRFSIISNDLNVCIECGSYYNVIKHEIYPGKNRQLSMKYGCVIPLCTECHTGNNGIHHNKQLKDKWQQRCQIKFESIHSHEKFMSIFKKNYLF